MIYDIKKNTNLTATWREEQLYLLEAVFHNTQYDYDDVVDLPELTTTRLHRNPNIYPALWWFPLCRSEAMETANRDESCVGLQ